MLTKLDGIRALYLELAWEQGEHDTGYGGAIKALGATLAVAEAAAAYLVADKAWKDAENDDCMDESDATAMWATETDAYLALQGTLAALEGEE